MEKRFTLVALVAAAVLMAAPFVVPSWQMEILTLALSRFLAVLAVALFLRAGLVNFGHALFYGVGAYTVGFASKWFGLREALILIPMGAVTGAAVAALVGLVMARYRGVFFAMLNLAFSMILYALLLKFYWVSGGTDGISVPTATILGIVPARAYYRMTYYYLSLGVAGIAIYAVYRFLASPLGYFLKAVADNEIRIEYSGESVQRVIYYTYILHGALGSMAGVLTAFTVGHIVPEDAFWLQSGEFVFVALLGGYGSVLGPLIGSISFEFLRSYASALFPYIWQMILGTIMLLMILFQPAGIWGMYEAIANRFTRRTEGVERA